jgi:hypothetical protein
MFANVYDWEPVAVVKAYDQVVQDRELETLVARGELGGMETIKVSDIGGLIGRIYKKVRGRQVCHLVGE